MFDYIKWRGDLDFSKSPFNPADNIILCQLSYLPLDGIVGRDNHSVNLAHCAEEFAKRRKKNPGASSPIFRDDPEFIKALGSARRFQNCELFSYVNHTDISAEKQFAALCVGLEDGSSFIAFRGTDSSIIGWKEDFNMSFSPVVPAQLDSVSYLEETAKNIRGPLRLGGHSKGGNLAVFAASFSGSRIRRRILEIYSNDAPGFHRSIIESSGYQAVKDRIRAFIPRSSVIGMLFEHGSSYTIIESSEKGIMQHDLYSWELTYNGMVHIEGLSRGSLFVDKTIKEWIGNLSDEQRRRFTEALYAILEAAEVKSFQELSADWLKNSFRMIQSLTNTDEGTKKVIGKVLTSLLQAARNNIETLLPPKRKK